MAQPQIDLNGRPETLRVRAQRAENVTWQGRPALLLDGLAFLPGWGLREGTISVDIGAEAATYCGVVFHGQDPANFELVYAQPHTSGRWDALQYDPVFHGSNTWQLYHGPGAQQATVVPTGEWFTLQVAFDAGGASVRVGDGEPLAVPRLAHGGRGGFIGVWSYLPAYFSNLRVAPGRNFHGNAPGDRESPPRFGRVPGLQERSEQEPGKELPRRELGGERSVREPGQEHSGREPGIVEEWFLEGYGRVACEPGGVLNVNRYLPVTMSEVRLVRRLNAEQETRRLDHTVECTLQPGEHILAATLLRKELFGWGLIMALDGAGVRLEPVAVG